MTIVEYMEWKQPLVASRLMKYVERSKMLRLSYRHWKRIMEERPMPGKAGGSLAKILQ